MPRTKGSKNKSTLAVKAQYDQLVRAYGCDPLEVLFMFATAKHPDGRNMRVDAALRIRAANDAASYGHSKLARTVVTDADTEQQYEFSWQDAEPSPRAEVSH